MFKFIKKQFQKFKQLKLLWKILIVISTMAITYIILYIAFGLIFVFFFVFRDIIPTDNRNGTFLVNGKQFVSIYQDAFNTKEWRVELDNKYWNKIIWVSNHPMNSIHVMNDKTDSVAAVVLYNNPNINLPRIIEYYEYGKEDSIGIINYYWCFSCTKNKKNYIDTIYIHRSELPLYKKADTIYLKPYL